MRWVEHVPGEKKKNMQNQPKTSIASANNFSLNLFSHLAWFFSDYRFLLKTSVYLSQLDFGEDTITSSVVR